MKERTSISIDKDLLTWVNKKIDEKIFASVSHAVEFALYQMMEKDKQ